MTTLPPRDPSEAPVELHKVRKMAESFGTDAEHYDRARPSYPDELVARILAGNSGREVLDVGCGTGIAARQFQAAGCAVLGVEPDARMAEFARDHGLEVEVATFETWADDGRKFDAVIAAQSWHWVDPAAGALKAADVLRPGGRLAIFGHVFEPPDAVSEALTAAYRRVVPESPFGNAQGRRPIELYQRLYTKIADTIRHSGQFTEPEQWRFAWQKTYTRNQWLDFLPTTGGLTQLHPEQLAEVLDDVGAAIDTIGGHFTMEFTTLATSAIHADPS